MAGTTSGSLAVFLCVCGHRHIFPREQALDNIAHKVWRCSECLRNFVIVHEPARDGAKERYSPFFLDGIQRGKKVTHTRGTEIRRKRPRIPEPPPVLWFECRCGRRIQCHSFMYGKSCNCPECDSRITPVVGYDQKTKEHKISPRFA